MDLKALYMYAAVLALLLCSAATFIQSPTDVFGPVALVEPTPSSARDFGAIVSDAPFVILRLDSTADIALLLIELSTAPPRPRATMVARGVGHSLQGQAQARDDIVVETRSLPRTVVVVAARASGKATAHAYADVGVGALWVEVLEECLSAEHKCICGA